MEELTVALQNLRAATARSSRGWNGVGAPVDTNLPVVLVAGSRVLVVWLIGFTLTEARDIAAQSVQACVKLKTSPTHRSC